MVVKWARLDEWHPLELAISFFGLLVRGVLCAVLTAAWLQASHGWVGVFAAALPLAWLALVAVELKRHPL